MSIYKRKITVLGGTGFVGTELITALAAAGHTVSVLTRHVRRGRHLSGAPNVRMMAVDVYQPKILTQALSGTDVVINLVGILNERGFGGGGFQKAHAQLTQTLINAAVLAGVPRLIQMSALGADEKGPSHYLRSKGIAERYIRAAPKTLIWTIFRPSVIFGARDALLNRFASLLRLCGGWIPLARSTARFAPVWVGDIVSAFEIALESPETHHQSYDLCGPEVITLAELVQFAGQLSGTPARILALPDSIGRSQALIMDFIPGKPFSSDNYRSLCIDNLCKDNGMRRIGITPAALRTMIP
ncbi:MAG: complex I NDUFA9 subunit family protein [Gammaproteobacteria bacterium]|nr:complex I NDUFA9 subunit family protein [Gammaproteobacteria bacterium]